MVPRRWLGLCLATAALLVGLALDAAPLASQSVTATVSQRRLEYLSARDAHQAAVSALRVVERSWSAALQEVQRARREGDAAALAAALPRAQDLSVPKADADRRVHEAVQRLDASRQALINALIVRQAELVGQVDAASNAERRAELNSLLDDISNQLTELEEEADDPSRLVPVVMPDITISPRDLPEQILSKAQVLERTAAVVDTVLVENAAQIAALEDRVRIERQLQDFLVNADRFGDRQVPTGPPRIDPTVQVSDSTDAGGRPVNLEQRLAAARAHREELIEYREQLLIRAQVFRQSIRRRS